MKTVMMKKLFYGFTTTAKLESFTSAVKRHQKVAQAQHQIIQKITNFCIINLENFMKIKYLIKLMNSAQNLITFKLSSQLNRLNLAANDFIAFSVTNNVFE
ncbi:Hypothetical_protein [Hexamita inflata]|uniref:Hypothetical_protein n=1 Tax=Hexamita inflata TaxID=28002 RepID=A0AA86TKU3_9EUKA|nr:Hypothetical protein HINF_LOCUS7921 [Hexamita inflata]